MRQARIAVLSAVLVSLLAGWLVGVPARAAGMDRCGGHACLTMQWNGTSVGNVKRGQPDRLSYYILAAGPADHVVLTVNLDAHLPVWKTGAPLVNGHAAAPDTVTVHRNSFRITLGHIEGTPDPSTFVSFDVAPDHGATTDMTTAATLTWIPAGQTAPTSRANVAARVMLERPALYLHAVGRTHLKRGQHSQASFLLGNNGTTIARRGTARITFPPHFTLSKIWGVRVNNRRVKCHGAGRRWTCNLTRISRTIGGGLDIDVHAKRSARLGHAARLTVVVTPYGYTNADAFNRAKSRLVVSRG